MAAFENLFYVDCCGMKIDKGRAPPLRVNRLVISNMGTVCDTGLWRCSA